MKDKKEVKISIALKDVVKIRLIELLREYANVFVWSYQDMPSFETDIVMHKLPLKEECPAVK